MKEKFNSLKGKLNLKILALLPLLLTLTGCGGDTKYLHHTLSATNWDFGGVISEALEKAGLEVAQFINGIFAKIILILYNLPTKVKEITFDSLSNYAMIGKVISLVQILAIALIIVNYAKSVAKHNMLQQGSGVSAITHLKKLSIALLAVFLVPYICISAYMASCYAGATLPSYFATANNEDANKWTINQQMDTDKVAYYTYCEAGQSANGVSKLTDLKSTNDTIAEDGTYQLLLKDSDLAKKYCIGESRNVFESLSKSDTYKNTLIVGGTMTLGSDTLDALAIASGAAATTYSLKGIGLILMALAYVVVYGVMLVGFFISIYRRVVDLVVLIATSWFYIGASVADDPNENSISSLWKKLLSLCLTNFVMILEFCIWLVLVIDTDNVFNVQSLLISIVWFKVMTSTPTAVESMVVSTNTTSNMAGAASTAARVGSKFLGK